MEALHEYARKCSPLIQVALDFTSMGEALRLASLLAGSTRRLVLEAGTPLIKSYGLEAVELLRALPGPGQVVADMKTMDTGGLEVEIAYRHGATATTVLGVAPDETIAEASSAAKRLGITLYGDLIGVGDPVERARRLEELGVDVILLHIGIDVQRKLGLTAGSRVEVVRRLRGEVKGLIAVAGGVKPREVRGLVDAGADIVIIGSAITRAEKPAEALAEAIQGAGGDC
ncbi:MAG: orotidine 5'-phosphate decarboxylase [Desulfurococcales archaeon]|nr:orotidine 5'-phosphate decarboxylase [Desulfurococcales archaeon]